MPLDFRRPPARRHTVVVRLAVMRRALCVGLLSLAAIAWLPLHGVSVAKAGAPDPLTEAVEQLRIGNAEAALASVERIDGELQQVPRVMYLRARLLDQLGRRAEALSLLRPLLDRVQGDAGGPDTAQGLPSTVIADARQRCDTWQAALTPVAPSSTEAATPSTTPQAPRTAQEKLERAQRHLDGGREQAAVDLLRGSPPRALRARWYHVRGMALFRLRNHYAEAARDLATGAAIVSDTQASDAFHAARALARDDQNSRAIVELRKFARRFPTSTFVAEALYLAAWLELRMGREVGFKRMEEFARSPLAKTAPSFRQEALWTLGYYAYTHRKLKDAERLLLEAAGATSEQMEQGAASYWAARAKLDQGDSAGAQAIWTELRARDPFHWYALLSHAQLTKLGVDAPAVAKPNPSSAHVAAVSTQTRVPEDAAFYAGIGLFVDASAALRKQESAVKSAAPPDQQTRALIDAYLAIGDQARAYHLTIADHAHALMTAWTADNDWIWRTTMATPHRAIVQREASAHGVDEGFVYAIMRKESAFDPRVVSYADALGLMQLLRSTAVKVARALGDAEPSREDLFRPAINIRLGTALLSQLEDELGGELALTMAGYNAGSHRVHQWLKHVSAKELDRFVEEIPIDQTRNYVRRVYANWARYRYLYEPKREPITLKLTLE